MTLFIFFIIWYLAGITPFTVCTINDYRTGSAITRGDILWVIGGGLFGFIVLLFLLVMWLSELDIGQNYRKWSDVIVFKRTK